MKRQVPGRHFVKHRAEAPEVRPFIDTYALCLLGRHITSRAHYHPGAGIDHCPRRRLGISSLLFRFR